MEKTKIAAPLSANRLADERAPSDPAAAERDRVPGSRLLADWELVMVGGGDMTPDW